MTDRTKQTKLYLTPAAHAVLQGHAKLVGEECSMSDTADRLIMEVLKPELDEAKEKVDARTNPPEHHHE